MKGFIFNGNWTFDYKLTKLARLNAKKFYNYWKWGRSHRQKLIEGYVPMLIWDNHDDNPDPTIEQIRAINYVKKNGSWMNLVEFKEIRLKLAFGNSQNHDIQKPFV